MSAWERSRLRDVAGGGDQRVVRAARQAAWERNNATTITPRELLLHSFAHVAADRAQPRCRAIRSRPFASGSTRATGRPEILIYTASSDSAGSLGGLSAQSQPDRIWAVVQSAIRRARWCSSDPVCIESSGSGADALNLAACHACVLLPETSCERMNRVLDRATLVGRPGAPDEGFFDRFID